MSSVVERELRMAGVPMEEPVCAGCGHARGSHHVGLFGETCSHKEWFEVRGTCECAGFVEGGCKID